MTTYFEKLYENIFKNIANDYTQLRIISGYASASFLSRVIDDFPHLKIDLFLGMSSQGVSKNNHERFISLVKTKENINVFYQVNGQPNHMKILEFSTESSKKIFVGSANFSENGFFNHREVMTEIDSLPAYLIEQQLEDSLLCTHDSLNDLIEFYDEELPEHTSTDNNSMNSDQIPVVDKSTSSGKHATQYFKKRKWELLKSKIDPRYYDKFEITVVLPSKNNIRWANKGINSWVDRKNPVLEQTPKLIFSKVFPTDSVFKIYSDDNKIIEAKLTGNFQGQLAFLNIDLYDYLRERIGLLEKRPISYEDLKSNGHEIMYFIRLNQNEYQMHFNTN